MSWRVHLRTFLTSWLAIQISRWMWQSSSLWLLLWYCVLWLGHKGVIGPHLPPAMDDGNVRKSSRRVEQRIPAKALRSFGLRWKVLGSLLMQIELNCSIYCAFYAIIMALCLTPSIPLFSRGTWRAIKPCTLCTLWPSCNNRNLRWSSFFFCLLRLSFQFKTPESRLTSSQFNSESFNIGYFNNKTLTQETIQGTL